MVGLNSFALKLMFTPEGAAGWNIGAVVLGGWVIYSIGSAPLTGCICEDCGGAPGVKAADTTFRELMLDGSAPDGFAVDMLWRGLVFAWDV